MAAAIDSVEVFRLVPADGPGLKILIKIQDPVLFPRSGILKKIRP